MLFRDLPSRSPIDTQVSVTTQSASFTAASGSSPILIAAPDDFTQSISHFLGLSSAGVATRSWKSKRAAAHRPALFLEGHHVGQHLAGMRTPGKPVDHRHRGMARELGHRLVVEDADHDRIDIAREHARCLLYTSPSPRD